MSKINDDGVGFASALRAGVAHAPTSLTALLKRHYETGCYGHTHLRMRREEYDTYPRGPRRSDFPPSPLVGLLGIPVVVDDTLPPATWQLVDNSTKQVLLTGSTTAVGTAGGGQPNASDLPEVRDAQ